MPQIEVTTLALPDETRRVLASRLTDVFVTRDTPPDWVKIIFRELTGQQFARGGTFPFWGVAVPSSADDGGRVELAIPGPAIAEITIGDLDEGQKRTIARRVSEALTDAGLSVDEVVIRFHHITGRDTAEGAGVFLFRPEGEPW